MAFKSALRVKDRFFEIVDGTSPSPAIPLSG
jgi:hypothetical protein